MANGFNISPSQAQFKNADAEYWLFGLAAPTQDHNTHHQDCLFYYHRNDQVQNCEIIRIFDTHLSSLSNIGGTLGLFLGSSLLSIVEILYWIFQALIKYLSRLWHGKPQRLHMSTRAESKE